VRVSAALREFAARRGGASRSQRSPAGTAGWRLALVVAKRCKPENGSPEETHVTFAADGLSFDVESPYPRRRGIEIGYKMVKQARMRTPGRDEGSKVFCFVASPVARNAWTTLHPGRRAAGDGLRVPMASPRTTVLPWVCADLGARPRMRTPRAPPP